MSRPYLIVGTDVSVLVGISVALLAIIAAILIFISLVCLMKHIKCA